MKFYERFKKTRTTIGISQAQLAANFKVDQKTVSHWETGRNDPPLEFLRTFCSNYNINLNWLLNEIGEMFLKEQDKQPPSKELDLKPELKEILNSLRQASDKIIDLNKLITYPPIQEKLPVIKEEKAIYSPPPWIPTGQADNYEILYPLADGLAACGIPGSPVEDNIIDYIPMSSKFNIKADFVIKTKGESMTEYGIMPGTLCFIKKQPVAENGDIVMLAVYEGGSLQPVLKKAKMLSASMVFLSLIHI